MTSTEELEAQLEATRRQLEALTAEVARNDEIMRRAQMRELRLLQAENLDGLIRALIDGLRVSYGVEYVSLVVCDPDHDIRHLLLANGTPAEEFQGPAGRRIHRGSCATVHRAAATLAWQLRRLRPPAHLPGR